MIACPEPVIDLAVNMAGAYERLILLLKVVNIGGILALLLIPCMAFDL